MRDLGMGPRDAVEGCRLHHQLQPNTLMVEPRCDVDTVRHLQNIGHKIELLDKNSFGTSVNLVIAADMNGVGVEKCEWLAISDQRKGGVGAGW